MISSQRSRIVSREVESAIDIVRQATELVRQIRVETDSSVMTKEDRSPVTIADFASQALIGRLFHDRFPSDPLCAEEDSSRLKGSEEVLKRIQHFLSRSFPEATPESICDWIDRGTADPADRFWTLDPIDGTKGYLKDGQYVVALALIENGRVEVGLLGAPCLDRKGRSPQGGAGALFVAVRGEGSWSLPLKGGGSWSRLSVSRCQDLTQARPLRSASRSHIDVERVDQLLQSLGVRSEPILMHSQAKYAVLAAGEGEFLVRIPTADPAWRYGMIWDHAAGSLIVEEAGGGVTDLEGRPLDFSAGRTLSRNRGLLATNRYLHPPILEALQELNP